MNRLSYKKSLGVKRTNRCFICTFAAKKIDMYRTHNCGELKMENVGDKVTLSAWVQKSRDLGGDLY